MRKQHILTIGKLLAFGANCLEYFLCEEVRFAKKYFIVEVSKGLLSVSVLTLVLAYFINSLNFEQSWLSFVFKGGVISIVYLILLYKLGMNKEEKALILNTIKR